MDKCLECPECACVDYAHEDELGEGFRLCIKCKQEWWTNINYKKYRSPAYYYEVFTCMGRSRPPKDKNGDSCSFDKRSVKRRARKLLKDGLTITVFLTDRRRERHLIYCNLEPTGFVNLIGL